MSNMVKITELLKVKDEQESTEREKLNKSRREISERENLK